MPCGIRLINPGLTPTTTYQNLYNQFAYVHQPEDISLAPVEMPPPPTTPTPFQTAARQALLALANQEASKTPPNTALAKYYNDYANFVNQPNSGPHFLLWVPNRLMKGTFNRGDVVEFGSTRYYLVTDAIDYPQSATPTDSLFVLHRERDETQSPGMPLPTARITRSARPIVGEPELNLPVDIAVDVIKTAPTPEMAYYRSWPAPDITAPSSNVEFDIMFSRTGEVTGGLGTYGRIILWVRDTSLGEPAVRGGLPLGNNRLIVIHTRTGQVTAHPVYEELNTTGGPAAGSLIDAYRFLRDGKSSAVE